MFENVIAGNFPFLFSSFVSAESAPSADTEKAAPFDIGDGTKPCCGCLGRDTIANAAAKVGSAVVNLSVPRGKFVYKFSYLCSLFSVQCDCL